MQFSDTLRNFYERVFLGQSYLTPLTFSEFWSGLPLDQQSHSCPSELFHDVVTYKYRYPFSPYYLLKGDDVCADIYIITTYAAFF